MTPLCSATAAEKFHEFWASRLVLADAVSTCTASLYTDTNKNLVKKSGQQLLRPKSICIDVRNSSANANPAKAARPAVAAAGLGCTSPSSPTASKAAAKPAATAAPHKSVGENNV